MLSLIKKVSKGQGKKITALVFLILISNILEGFGIGLILPVFQKILNQAPDASGVGKYIDLAISQIGIVPNLLNTLILLNLAFVLKTLIAVAAKYFSTYIASDYMNNVQVDLFSKLLKSKISLFNQEKHGKFVNGLTIEIARTSNVFIQVANWISSLITAILYLMIALKISITLAVLAGLLGLICVAPLRLINNKATQYGKRWTLLNEEIQNLIGETLSGIKYIKASNYDTQSETKFKMLSRKFRDNWSVMAFNSNLAALFSHPIGVLVLSFLLYLSVSFSISLPELIVFLLAFMRLLPTLTGLAGIKNDINANLAALENIEEIKSLSLKNAENTGGAETVNFHNSIEIENISFRHNSSIPLIENLSWKISFGKTIAITGQSGRGKTTLVDLILKLHEPQNGIIKIDGKNLKDLNLNNWRSQTAYVAQETFLFHESIKNNILIGNPLASQEELENACKMAHAHEFIINLENGYDTIVGDRGSKLSGGQKQRVALARALIKKPKLLILDEATSALDNQSEEFIKKTIHELKKKKEMTVIIIAHRMTTVEEAEEVFTI